VSNLPSGTEQFLAANNEAYEWLVREITTHASTWHPELLLRKIEAAAKFASNCHTGRFADGAIENLALRIGRELRESTETSSERLPRADCRRRVLHYFDRVHAVGGHTRTLMHWALHDRTSRHSLALAFQEDVPVPTGVEKAVTGSGGTITRLPETPSRIDRALFLRHLAKQADLVVLHHSAWDSLPVVAFAVEGLPPIAVLNHADHIFWLGSSVTDLVINLRSASIPHSRDRRFVENNAALPIPLADHPAPAKRQSVRRQMGMADDEIVLLSVARAEKYRPCGEHDFVATATRILEREPSAHVFVVGESAEGISRHIGYPLHPRLHFVGQLEDPSPYWAAADIYLESFPFGSNTALLEAALAGLPVVPAPSPLSPQLIAGDDGLWEIISNPSDQQEYVSRAARLMREPEVRRKLGTVLRERMLARNVGSGWLEELGRVYAQTDHLVHSPHPIPIAPSIAEDADLGLCLWQVMSGDGTPAAVRHGGLSPAVTQGTFARQRVGDFGTARRIVLSALASAPLDSASWKLAKFSLRSHVGAALRWLRSGDPLLGS